MSGTLIEFDDLFVWAPSILIEGKSLGTAPELDLLFLDLDKTIKAQSDPEGLRLARKSGMTVGKRRLRQVQSELEPKILKLVLDHDKLPHREGPELKPFKEAMHKLMKKAWKDVFEAGVRSSGTPGMGKSKRKAVVDLTAADQKWLKSAMQHEMRFLNGLISAVDDGTWIMPLPKRVEMYVRALESFYDTARAIGLPATVIIRWVGANDDRTCVGCAYLFKHTPYTKVTLPTVPRAGLTPCLCLLNSRNTFVTALNQATGLPIQVRLSEVVVGDYVLTHRRRWRRVLDKHENQSLPEHRYAAIVGEGGKLFGVTSDHPVYTRFGWMAAEAAAREEIEVKAVSELSDENQCEVQDGFVPDVRAEGAVAIGVRSAVEKGAQGIRLAKASALRGSGDRVIRPSQEGWSSLRSVLGQQEVALHLPLSVGLDPSARRDPGRLGGPPQELGSDRRSAGEPGTVGATPTRQTSRVGTQEGISEGTHAGRVPEVREGSARDRVPGGSDQVLLEDVSELIDGESSTAQVCGVLDVVRGAAERDREGRSEGPSRKFLLTDLLRDQPSFEGVEDPAVRLLRDEVRETPERSQEIVRVGQVLLLSCVLPPGSLLYDLTVDEDHSFVVDGMVIHNSNCRDRLLIQQASPDKVIALTNASKTRATHIRNLRKLKSKGYL